MKIKSYDFRKKPTALLIAILVLVLFLPAAYYLTTHPFKAQAAWFDDPWGFRKRVDITNGSGSNQTNYQVSFILNTTDTTKFQTDCDDIRVTASNGELLPHWIEENNPGCGSATTKIWTKVPSIPTSGTYIYVYYGNPTAVNTANGTKVFEFFDDFNEASINTSKWITGVTGSGTVTQTGGYLKLNSVGGTGNSATAANRTAFTPGFRAIWYSNFVTDRNNQWQLSDGAAHISQDGIRYLDYVNNANAEYHKTIGGAYTTIQTEAKKSTGNHSVSLAVGSSGNASYTVDSNTYTTTGLTAANIKYIFNYAQGEAAGNSEYWNDWAIITKFVSNEPTTAAPTNEEKSPAPVAYWKLDEGYGGNTSDATGHGYSGTLTNSPTWQAEDLCVTGKCLRFDGTNKFVNVGTNTVFNLSTYTISAWFRASPNTGTYSKIFYKGNASTVEPVSVYLYNGQATCEYFNNPTDYFARDDTRDLRDNKWHQIICVRNPGVGISLYIDGALKNTGIDNGNTSTVSDAAVISGRGSGTDSFFNGDIDEVKVFNYVRTAAQVKTDYNAGKAHAATAKGTSVSFSNRDNNDALSNGLSGYWKMDEATWNNNCSATSVTDSSGNANNGKSCSAGTGPTGGAAGKFGHSGSFDGGDDYVEATPSKTGRTFVTIAGWVNFEGSDNINNVDKYHHLFGWNYEFFLTFRTYTSEPGAGYFIWLTGTTANGSTNGLSALYSLPAKLRGWHHIAATYDGSKALLFLDGAQVASQSIADTGIRNNGRNFHIGGDTESSQYYDSQIDDVRLYYRALQPSEVSFLYNFAPGPVGYWKLDENTGTAANDTSGTGLTGTWNGTGSHWTNGKYGAGGNFNGSDDFTNIPDNTAIKFGAGNFTITAWVNSQQAGQEDSLVSKDNVGVTNVYYKIYKEANDKITCAIWDGTTASGATSITALSTYKWYHVACIRDGDNVRVYVSGVNENTGTGASGVNTDSTAALKIGAQRPTTISFFKGLIDDVRIYNYARTAGQIVEDMNASHPIGGSPLSSKTVYWKFDEGYSATAFNSGTSGSTNNGTLTPGSSGTHTSAYQMWSNRGQVKKAADFDGVDDRIVAGTAAILHGKTAGTLSTWVKTTSDSNAEDTIYSENWAGAPVIQMNISGDNKLGFNINQSGGTWQICTDTTAFTANRWYYLVGTFDVPTHTIKFYVDNVLKCTVTAWNGTFNGTISQVLIGDHAVSGVYSWTGLIDEMKIYNSVLTADQIKLDYNQGSAQVLGSLSTSSDGTTASNSAERSYCVPGDTGTCSAPVGEWNLNENTGSSANDTSGNGNTGSWNGTGTNHWVIGKIGSAGNLNGSDDYLNVDDSTSLDIANAITISTWINLDTNKNYNQVLTKGADVSENYEIIVTSTGLVTGDWQFSSGRTNCANSGTTTLSTGRWYHFGVTFDGSSCRTYINGVLVNTISIGATTMVPNNNALQIGGDTSAAGRYLDGKLDQIKIYNYARTAAQIAWDFNYDKPYNWWKFDECQGSTLHDSADRDNSGTWNGTGGGSQTAVGTCTTSGTAWFNGVTGKYNSSLNFDGTDDFVSMSSVTFLDDKSISAWIYTSVSNVYQEIFGWSRFASVVDYDAAEFRLTNTGKLQYQDASTSFGGNGARTVTTTQNILLNQWVLVTTTKSGSTVKLYVNGIEAPVSYTNGAFAAFSFTPLKEYIGAFDFSGTVFPFTGQIDDIRIYNYGLTQVQIKDLYNQGSAVRYGPASGIP